MRADLHTHSVCSDGELLPKQIVDFAVKAGVELIAVTDHDAMQACGEVAAFAKEAGIRSVDGIEVSAYDGTVKFHTLGYGMDKEKFKTFLKRLYESSAERAEDIIKKLNAINIPVTWDDVNEQRYSLTAPIHGIHIARAVVKLGYVESTKKFFSKYLAPKKPAFSVIRRPSPKEAVRAIVEAGGFASVAHPARIDMDADELKTKIKQLKDEGLGGIEVYYSTHTEEKTAYYYNLAEELSLLKTGGSDTHNPTGKEKIGTPVFNADDRLLEKLRFNG
ncbi:MAG: PHP domain-containing protein [Clostridia bacterium]|nr:PHP domain-containing protein [Clostridia bacterium]